MKKNFTLTPETAGYLEAIIAMDNAYNIAFLTLDDILEKGIDATSEAIKPFQEKFNEAKAELYKLLSERIQGRLYEYNEEDKDIQI